MAAVRAGVAVAVGMGGRRAGQQRGCSSRPRAGAVDARALAPTVCMHPVRRAALYAAVPCRPIARRAPASACLPPCVPMPPPAAAGCCLAVGLLMSSCRRPPEAQGAGGPAAGKCCPPASTAASTAPGRTQIRMPRSAILANTGLAGRQQPSVRLVVRRRHTALGRLACARTRTGAPVAGCA